MPDISDFASRSSMIASLETIKVHTEGAVLFAQIAVPPMNLLTPALVRDLVSLMQHAEADDTFKVIVFASAVPDYFIAHVDVTKVKEYREATAKLPGESSLGLLFRHISASRLVTIAQVEGRTRGVGNEFALACDMRFAARETAIFAQPEPALGLIPGAGGVQHLTRLLGRARALEAILGSEDFTADQAERYGWVNRALPASELDSFVKSLALRIASFPASALAGIKTRVNAIGLADADDFIRDSELFVQSASRPETQKRIGAALQKGLQTRDGEMDFGRLIDELT
jgi:enoyl-CoA hydratase/carnithine racemase